MSSHQRRDHMDTSSGASNHRIDTATIMLVEMPEAQMVCGADLGMKIRCHWPLYDTAWLILVEKGTEMYIPAMPTTIYFRFLRIYILTDARHPWTKCLAVAFIIILYRLPSPPNRSSKLAMETEVTTVVTRPGTLGVMINIPSLTTAAVIILEKQPEPNCIRSILLHAQRRMR